MAQTTENATQEPQFVKYLLDPEQEYDCYFLVGNSEFSEPERIGVVKKMLLAHSLVMRRELQESHIKEKGVVKVCDLFPNTFKNLLRFVYGFDNTMSLSFDEADNLLYAAEKYEMLMLKARLATRLMELLSVDNICSLMNNPACYTDLELNSAITHILQGETGRVLATPLFLDLTGDSFNRILEQEALSVPEIELWRAALKWAKHKTGSEDGLVLRKHLAEQTKHIRICTVSHQEFCDDVMFTKVMTNEESKFVCLSLSKKEKQEGLVHFCNEIEPRKRSSDKKGTICFAVEYEADEVEGHQIYFQGSGVYRPSEKLTIITKKHALELMPFEFLSTTMSTTIPEGAAYQCDCTIVITRITDYVKNTSTETPVTVVFRGQVEYNKKFVVPVISNGQNVTLRPKSKYTIKVTFTENHIMYQSDKGTPFSNDHLSLDYSSAVQNNIYYGGGFNSRVYYYSPIRTLSYRTVLEPGE